MTEETLLDRWEIAIATAVRPLTESLELPIAALPVEANKFLYDQKELVDFLFTEAQATGRKTLGTVDVRHTLVFRIYLTHRYPKDLGQKKAVSWVTAQIISYIHGLMLPGAYQPVEFERSRLFAPDKATWYTEVSFFVFSSLSTSRSN